jgi:ATP-dependent DNA ligase
MLERPRRTIGLIEPCLPSPAKAPPSGPDWLHEIKHDGFRILPRRGAAGVRLYTRNGHDFSKRFPQVVIAIAALPARSCLIDGEAIVSGDDGLAVFELLRSFRYDHAAVLCAFDLTARTCAGCRSRCAKLAQLLRKPFARRQACKLAAKGSAKSAFGIHGLTASLVLLA